MKKTFALFNLLCFLLSLTAQNISDLETFEQAMKPGTVLTYDVNMGGKQYNLLVTIKKLGEAISFDWKTTDPANKTGTVNMNAEAVKNADALSHFFNGGESNLDKETSLFLPRKIFAEEGAEASAALKVNGASDTATVMSNTISEFNFNVNGNLVAVPGWELEGGSDIKYTIDVMESNKFPLIYRLDLGWTMILSKVESL